MINPHGFSLTRFPPYIDKSFGTVVSKERVPPTLSEKYHRPPLIFTKKKEKKSIDRSSIASVNWFKTNLLLYLSLFFFAYLFIEI